MKFYITAAIPYVNAKPHLGHALEFTLADTIARDKRLRGANTLLLTGADENSIKNVSSAAKKGISVKDLCDENSAEFLKLKTLLNTSFDVYKRSSDKSHFKGSRFLWKLCEKSGDIYKKNYSGLYCQGCEAFYEKEELTKDFLCPEHLSKPEIVAEENYFFRLSKYENKIKKLISEDKIRILPQTRKNEVLAFINSGLKDISVSRSIKRAKGWGVPVPGSSSQIMYVWFDALNVYQTGIGFATDDIYYKKFWPADVHVIGKGIIRFHAVYWPAMLLSAGLKLPSVILSHGYITIEGQKMSKTLGNTVDPAFLISNFKTDAVRYYLLREIPTFSDGDFSMRRFHEIYNSDLADNLGNLISRITTLIEKANLHTKISPKKYGEILRLEKYLKFKKMMDSYRISEALEELIFHSTKINQVIDRNAPWKMKGRLLDKFLLKTGIELCELALLLKPFLPETGEKIVKILQGVEKNQPLFPKNKN